jgi:putative ABC transport system ATP-binding protein
LPLIKLNHLTREYPTGSGVLKALDRVSLSILSGEFVAIMGASGSGKSTMLNILGLLDRPTSGEYFLAGKNVTLISDDDQAMMRNKKIGFIFQSFYLLPRLDALRNVMMPLLYRGDSIEDAREKALIMLDKLGMKSRHHHKPNQLSGGEQQRIAVARALVGNPDVILADEPTGSLDSKTGQQLMDLFKQMHLSENRTIIIITHDEKIANQCERVIVLKDGKIVSE